MYNFLSSGAFVETFTIEPYSSGSLNGLKFAIKDRGSDQVAAITANFYYFPLRMGEEAADA